MEATEKYGSQTSVEVLPNGHYVMQNYHGGTPFPNPQDPNKGWKILANVFWAYRARDLCEQPGQLRLGLGDRPLRQCQRDHLDVVYRWSDLHHRSGLPADRELRPGHLVHRMG